MNINKIEGIGPQYATKLEEQGVRTTDSLLNYASHRKGREQLASSTGIPEKKILEWVNRADLMRIKGIGEEYSDLLEVAGVDTVKELANRNPENLHRSLLETNAAKKLVRHYPSLSQVQNWVNQAKNLPAVVTY